MKHPLPAIFRTLTLMSLCAGLALSAASHRKRPTLVSSGETDKVRLVFQTSDSPQSAVVSWGLTPTASDASTSTTTQTDGDNFYSMEMDGLQPGQRYYYKITMDGSVDTGSFVAPRSEDRGDFTFYAYGDTRTNYGDHNAVCSRIISDVNQNPSARSTFILHCGDFVESGTDSNWNNWFSSTVKTMLQSLRLYGAVGNHEGGISYLKKYFPYTPLAGSGWYYSFTDGPVHVAVVDQETTSYSSGSAQINWLKNDLAASTAPCKIVMFHEPAYGAGGGHADNGTAKSVIVPLCEQYKVAMVIAGHNHYYARIVQNGIQHITAGRAGAPGYTPSTSTSGLQKSSTSNHFLRLEVINNATQLRTTVIRSDGSTVETFTVNLSTNPPQTYALTVNSGNGDGNYASGANVTITANAAPTGQVFSKWVISSGSPVIANANAPSTTLTMPSGAATVTATYANSGGPAGYTWCANENGSYTFATKVDVAYGANGKFNYKYGVTGAIPFNNATFGDPIVGVGKAGYYKASSTTTYALTVNSGSGSGNYKSGATATITANAAPSGQVFSQWVATSGSPEIANVNATSTTLTMPANAATVTATYKPSGSASNSLATNGTLITGQKLTSSNAQYRLTMQGDGNLVLYNASNAALWATGTNGKGGTQVKLQGDGNLVIYTSSGSPIWASNTVGTGANLLKLNDDGSLVLYKGTTVVKTLYGTTPPPPGDTFPWGSTNVHYSFSGGVNESGGGTKSSPAKSGDYELVFFGASHGGGSGNDGTYFDKSKMVNQGFQPIVIRGSDDRKAEMWVRRNSGQTSFGIPSLAVAHVLVVLEGQDVQLNLGSITSTTVFSSGTSYQVPNPSGSGLKMLCYFSDDPVELTNVGSGKLLWQKWSFGDGDGFHVVLYPSGVSLPSSVSIRNYDPVGQQYVGISANFNK